MAYEGDVILAPGFGTGSTQAPVEILKSTARLRQHGGTVAPNQGDLPAGTAMKLNTDTKRFEKATAATDVVAFLRLGISTGDAKAMPRQGVLVFGGVLVASKLNLNGSPITAEVATALSGTLRSNDLDELSF